MNADKEPLLFFSDDDFEDGDEYPEIDVESLNAQVDSFTQGHNTPLQTTIITAQGQRIGPTMMTPQEAQDCLAAKREYERTVLSEMLTWLGRLPGNDMERAALSALRQRAEMFLAK